MSAVTADLIHGTTVRLSNGTDTWVADEPLDVGGADAGPNPYELLLGALGACTAITISLYCRRKGIALDSVSAKYELERVHADDCDDCEEGSSGFLERVKAQIFIEGDFDEATGERLVQIAQRCPVHKTLGAGVQFSEEIYADRRPTA